MSSKPIFLKVSTEETNNPKAVFLGNDEDFITPIAEYLSERNVDLYTGKDFSDAYFGDYLLYFGTIVKLNELLKNQTPKLPKTLWLLQNVSQEEEKKLEEFLKLYSKSQVVIFVNINKLNPDQVEEIVSFFFGEKTKILYLKGNQEVDTPVILSLQNDVPSIIPSGLADQPVENNKIAQDEPGASDDNHNPKLTPKRVKYITEEIINVPPKNKQREMVDEGYVNKPSTLDPEIYLTKETEAPIAQKETREVPDFISSIYNASSEKESQINNLYTPDPIRTGVGRGAKFKRFIKPLFTTLVTLSVVVILSIVVPVLIFTGELFGSVWFLKAGQDSFLKNNLAQASTHTKRAATLSTLATTTQRNLMPFYSLIGLQNFGRQLESFTFLIQSLSLGTNRAFGLLDESSTLIKAIAGDEKGVAIGSLMATMKGDLTLVDSELGTAQAYLQSGLVNSFFDIGILRSLKSRQEESVATVKQLRMYVNTLRQGLQVLPHMIGLSGKQVYLVLFQNNMELRPTGGFIGSFGLLTFEDGVMKELKIEDVYTADGALKGHVDPPLPIKTYLKQEHWYLRDSNWDPDFPSSAQQAMWFLEKELDVSVDGVIAVDVTMAEYMLEVAGKLDIPDLNTSISAENLYLKLQTQSHENFFPGSTQKKDLLGSVARSLFLELIGKKELNMTKLLTGIHQGLNEKHLILYFKKPETESLIQKFGWNGSILPQTCPGQKCYSNTLFVVDANLGVNKANYFVRRNMVDNIHVGDSGEISQTINLTYKNTSPKEDKLGGDYFTYIRIYQSDEVTLKRAEVNGIALSMGKGELASPSAIASYPEKKFQVFALPLTVGIQEEKTVTLEFVSTKPLTIKNGETGTFQIALLKQPGVVGEAASITVQYPGIWTYLPENDPAGEVAGVSTLVKQGEITYNTAITGDELFILKFKH